MTPSTWQQRLLILPPVALGAAVLWFAVATRPQPPQVEPTEPVRKVRIVEAARGALTPRVEAYAAAVWNAVAEVSGRIIQVHPKLADGAIIRPGETLVRIDPRSFELTLAQLDAERTELNIQEANSRASLLIERRNVELTSDDLARQKQLGNRGTTARNAIDQTERTMLSSQQAVRSLENTLDLERTEIRAPFALRISALKVENNQYVGIGTTLLKGDSIERAEVHAELAPEQMRGLTLGMVQDGALSLEDLANALRARFGLTIQVRFSLAIDLEGWDAQFERTKQVDSNTRTIGVVASVADPYKGAKADKRPPLVSGMFVRMDLSGRARQPSVRSPHGSA